MRFPLRYPCVASSTRSEIVLPVRNRTGDLIAALDIDSDRPGAFDATDARELQALLDAVFAH